MKKEIAEKWIAALRSGEYKQTTHYLREDPHGFCCLGVLCNLHAQEHPEYAAAQIDPHRYGGRGDFLPNEVTRWAGMSNNAGRYGQIRTLAFDNDQGKTFAQIADTIEENVERL